MLRPHDVSGPLAGLVGLLANTLLGAWWLDGIVAFGIAAWAVAAGPRAWAGEPCSCGTACARGASTSSGWLWLDCDAPRPVQPGSLACDGRSGRRRTRFGQLAFREPHH